MPWPHTFAAAGGDVAASQLDDNFNAAAFAADLTALEADVAALPSTDTPLAPVAGGDDGSATDLSKSDHQHPVQTATENLQTGTSYTVQASDDGKIVSLTNGSAITLTIGALGAGFNCGFLQGGAGQVTFVGSGVTLRQRQSLTKTAGQYALVTVYIRDNGTDAVLSGDMA